MSTFKVFKGLFLDGKKVYPPKIKGVSVSTNRPVFENNGHFSNSMSS